MTPLKLIRYGAWAVVAALGVLIGVVLLSPPKAPEIAQPGRIGGPFQLAMASGGELNSTSLRGKPYALFFGFTNCPDICPGTLTEITQLLDELDKGPLAPKVKAFRILFVTVDPERDSAPMLASYLSAFDNRVVGLVPKLEALPALTKQFAAFYEKVPTSSSYTMNHTSAVYLFDGEGRFSGTLDITESKTNQRAKLERLLAR
jgi:protein SCO1